jgi:membrane protease YdiL (CAAX protease family)
VRKITAWVKQHQILAFYLLVYGISWPAMIVAFSVFSRNAAMQAPFGLMAVFSPALVALMISAISKPEPKQAKSPARWIAFVCGWLFAWLVLSLHMWQVRGVEPGPQVIIPAGLVALLPGWLLSCAYSRLPGVRELFGTVLRPRGHVVWYLVALFTVPAVQVIGAGITMLAGGEASIDLNDRSFLGAAFFIGLMILEGFLVSGGINEESGWRGFVLPRLQARFPVIGAVAIVWFFWALWHIPYDIGNHTPVEEILFNRILLNFIWAVLFAWVYNRTNGSLLAPALFHPSMNAFGDTLPRTDVATVLFVILVLAVIVYERMWRKLPEDSPATCA